ncbi:histidine kinase [Mesorhizobium sp. NBSH29]|nr:histidine kinase [Mesorhizobium sp. NBSH29]QPC85697.1 histidine kinase [Mesorhizobium sp. NBSH29]
MPTLFRLLSTIAFFAAVIYGSMYALATFVEPKKAEISVRVPLDKLGQP